MKTTVILGASSNPERYSNRAQHKLTEHGHPVILISQKGDVIDGVQSLPDIAQVKDSVDTVTLYINPTLLESQLDKIIRLKPRRVIFNPGTESASAQKKLEAEQIEVVNNCTLVMLTIGTY